MKVINKKVNRKQQRKKSARLLDRIRTLLHSPDYQLLNKRERTELTELCAQTMSPNGSKVSELKPKTLLAQCVPPEKPKTDKKF